MCISNCGGTIGLVEDGDEIEIDVHERLLRLNVVDAELDRRREAKGPLPWTPVGRDRMVSKALKAYAAMVRPASFGAVREVRAGRTAQFSLRTSSNSNG